MRVPGRGSRVREVPCALVALIAQVRVRLLELVRDVDPVVEQAPAPRADLLPQAFGVFGREVAIVIDRAFGEPVSVLIDR